MKRLVLLAFLFLVLPATAHAHTVSCANIRAAVASGYSPHAAAKHFHVSVHTVNYCLGRGHPYHRACCKVCYRGLYACGNSCISRHYPCHQPRGCACNG
jgi:hypothetical protein